MVHAALFDRQVMEDKRKKLVIEQARKLLRVIVWWMLNRWDSDESRKNREKQWDLDQLISIGSALALRLAKRTCKNLCCPEKIWRASS